MFVKFWGTRGSIPTPGRRTARYGGNTSCVEVRAGDSLLICDAGTGLRELGRDLIRRQRHGDLHFLFSHTHWDHIQGFPFFEPAYSEDTTLRIWEADGGRQGVYRLLSGQMQPDYFPVRFVDLGSRIIADQLPPGRPQDVGAVTVRHFRQHHPGASWAFSLEADGRKVVFSTDNELDLWLEDLDATVLRPEPLRQLPPAFVDFVRGADLLIVDGQYTDEEYERHRGWGHSRASTAIDLGVQAGVPELALFHHDPMQDDEALEETLSACRTRAEDHGSPMVVWGAREGLELKLG